MSNQQDDKPTEALYIDKDQADALLIICNQQAQMLEMNIKAFQFNKEGVLKFIRDSEPTLTPEQVLEIAEEHHALDKSVLETIPSILDELKELYPFFLEEKHKPSKIILPPSWTKKP